MGDNLFQRLRTMTQKGDKNFFILGFISFAVFLFYCFYINFSIDTIILFLSNKIFLGKWLAKGIFPWFNPHIFLGTPYAFDVGIGSFHPFNLFFLLPYPYSFAVWMGATSFLFLVGYYLLLKDFTKTKFFAFLLTLILFFSGSGLFRANNPTIYIVLAHAGFYLWSLKFIRVKSTLPLFIGVLLILSGHVQFVIYILLFGIFISKHYYKNSFSEICIFYGKLFLITAWYFILSLPLVFESTRLTMQKEYVETGSNSPLHIVQMILPFVFGYIANGSRWIVTPTYTVVVSFLYLFFLLIAYTRKKIREYSILVFIFIASFGFFNFPFLRNAGQITALAHILGLLIIAQSERGIDRLFVRLKKKIWIFLVPSFFILSIGLLCISPIFMTVFYSAFSIIRKNPGLFYDSQTIQHIGSQIGYSFMFLSLFFIILFVVSRFVDKLQKTILIVFIITEGVVLSYAFNYFVPTKILTNTRKFPIISQSYRIQSTPDVIPYHGISFYMSDIMLQPPFSKEKAYVDKKEKKTYAKLVALLRMYPTTWIMTSSYNAIQGFNTFMLADLAKEFASPSPDFREEYKYIIDRNPLFAESKQDTSINSISSGHLTLTDPRWEKLGVRYFISDRPLKKYKLLEKKDGRYIYENEWALPIYRTVIRDSMSSIAPQYTDPNTWKFQVDESAVGGELQMVMNPGGFVATLNNKRMQIKKEKFLIRVPITTAGLIVVRYSPLEHLLETLKTKIKLTTPTAKQNVGR